MDQLQVLALMELLKPRRVRETSPEWRGERRTHGGGSPRCSGAQRTVLNRTVSPPSPRAEDRESPITRSGSMCRTDLHRFLDGRFGRHRESERRPRHRLGFRQFGVRRGVRLASWRELVAMPCALRCRMRWFPVMPGRNRRSSRAASHPNVPRRWRTTISFEPGKISALCDEEDPGGTLGVGGAYDMSCGEGFHLPLTTRGRPCPKRAINH